MPYYTTFYLFHIYFYRNKDLLNLVYWSQIVFYIYVKTICIFIINLIFFI